MTEWKSYPHNRKIKEKESYVIIVPESFDEKSIETMPIFCSVCKIRFGRKEDEDTYKKFRCCSSCADNWAYSHKMKWQDGWRPSLEEIELSVEKRRFVNPDIVFE